MLEELNLLEKLVSSDEPWVLQNNLETNF